RSTSTRTSTVSPPRTTPTSRPRHRWGSGPSGMPWRRPGWTPRRSTSWCSAPRRVSPPPRRTPRWPSAWGCGDVERVPIFGLGCAAGAAGLSRLYDYRRAWPDQAAVLVCVELCSLTAQRDDGSLANLVASGLFGDGAAAVVAVGAGRGTDGPGPGRWGPRIVATRSKLYPGTARLMGWDVGEHGFRIVLAADLVDHVEATLAGDVAAFLGEHGLSPGEVSSWVCHPGGPKVIEKVAEAFALDDGELDLAWDSLRKVGNMSSVSVLNVLEETIER